MVLAQWETRIQHNEITNLRNSRENDGYESAAGLEGSCGFNTIEPDDCRAGVGGILLGYRNKCEWSDDKEVANTPKHLARSL